MTLLSVGGAFGQPGPWPASWRHFVKAAVPGARPGSSCPVSPVAEDTGRLQLAQLRGDISSRPGHALRDWLLSLRDLHIDLTANRWGTATEPPSLHHPGGMELQLLQAAAQAVWEQQTTNALRGSRRLMQVYLAPPPGQWSAVYTRGRLQPQGWTTPEWRSHPLIQQALSHLQRRDDPESGELAARLLLHHTLHLGLSGALPSLAALHQGICQVAYGEHPEWGGIVTPDLSGVVPGFQTLMTQRRTLDVPPGHDLHLTLHVNEDTALHYTERGEKRELWQVTREHALHPHPGPPHRIHASRALEAYTRDVSRHPDALSWMPEGGFSRRVITWYDAPPARYARHPAAARPQLRGARYP